MLQVISLTTLACFALILSGENDLGGKHSTRSFVYEIELWPPVGTITASRAPELLHRYPDRECWDNALTRNANFNRRSDVLL